MLEVIEVLRDSPYGQKLMKEIYELRYETYSKLGWIPYSKEKAKLVKDEFDNIPHTTHFAIIEDNGLIGCNRLTKYSPEFKLPLIKDGLSLEIFKNITPSISEGSRLVIKQDRKYPGCVLQLLFHSSDYVLKNMSEFICSIGNPEYNGLFTYLGIRIVNKDIDCVLDKKEDKVVVVKGVPLLLDRSTLNNNLDLNKYTIKRKFVVIKNE